MNGNLKKLLQEARSIKQLYTLLVTVLTTLLLGKDSDLNLPLSDPDFIILSFELLSHVISRSLKKLLDSLLLFLRPLK